MGVIYIFPEDLSNLVGVLEMDTGAQTPASSLTCLPWWQLTFSEFSSVQDLRNTHIEGEHTETVQREVACSSWPFAF